MSEHPPGYTPLPASLMQDLMISSLKEIVHSCPKCRGSDIQPYNFKWLCPTHSAWPNYYGGNYDGYFGGP